MPIEHPVSSIENQGTPATHGEKQTASDQQPGTKFEYLSFI
jgi:hypothetical protein